MSVFEIFIRDNNLQCAIDDFPFSARDLFDALQASNPSNVYVVPFDGMDDTSSYMRVFNGFKRLAGLGESVKRVIAIRRKDNPSTVDLSCYINGVKNTWSFSSDSKYLEEDFINIVYKFYKKHAQVSVALVSGEDEPFLEYMALPKELVVELKIRMSPLNIVF